MVRNLSRDSKDVIVKPKRNERISVRPERLRIEPASVENVEIQLQLLNSVLGSDENQEIVQIEVFVNAFESERLCFYSLRDLNSFIP